MESETNLHIGQSGLDIYRIACIGMPIKHHIEPLETPFAHHISFSAATLFSGTSEETDCPRMPFSKPFRNCNGACCGSYAEQVVATRMSSSAAFGRLTSWDSVLRHAGQGVIFGHDANYRSSLAISSNESGWDSRNTSFDTKSMLFQMAAQQVGASVFVVTRFGKAMNLLLQGVVEVEMAVNIVQTGVGPHIARGASHRYAGDQKGQQQKCFFHMLLFFKSQPFSPAKNRMTPPAVAQAAMNPPPKPFTKTTGANVTSVISTGAI